MGKHLIGQECHKAVMSVPLWSILYGDNEQCCTADSRERDDEIISYRKMFLMGRIREDVETERAASLSYAPQETTKFSYRALHSQDALQGTSGVPRQEVAQFFSVPEPVEFRPGEVGALETRFPDIGIGQISGSQC